MKLINKEVRIETTNICQAKCTICPREKMTRPLGIMLFEQFTELVDQAVSLGAETISLFGYGEPLLDPRLADRVAYCTKRGLKTFITTNGALLSMDNALELLEAGLSSIRFSVHGLWAMDYEKVHGGIKFFDTIRNIFNFIHLNRRAKNGHSCETNVSVIPMHHERLEDIQKMWEPHVDYLEVWKPHNWTDGRTFREPCRKKTTCGRPAKGPVQINWDGRAIVCCFDYDAQLIVGDTYMQTIEEILKGNEYQVIRNRHASGDLEGLICDNCDQLNEYTEEDSPLLYSSKDKDRQLDCTSSTKFKLID
ncbi:MAG: radical SAM/SPASM domain-containing protein [Chloroflexota bacterium]|nr:radical SAM/SPASM domain-containing protein [Chloroflexota bacterium]